MLGIKDVIRPEIPEAIKKCHAAGIKVRMITGDNKITATNVAQECGIFDDSMPREEQVMEGPEFFELLGGFASEEGEESKGVKNLEKFREIEGKLMVLARARPEDKLLLVMALQEVGGVVAVTGDGTNDAPAIKKADVGFALGISGTDIAKEAADMLVLDDSFNSVINACMLGRK